jgi:UDP-3-O-[3-hydroxymyristoyl] glucosamine N-acyltransferase
MNKTIAQIAEFLGAKYHGDPKCEINGVAPLNQAQMGQLSFLRDHKHRDQLPTTQASVVILPAKFAQDCPVNYILSENPHADYAKVASLFAYQPQIKTGTHASAMVGENCEIASTASIGANCVVGDRVTIEEGVVIHPGVCIGDDVHIGRDSIIWSNVTLYYAVRIGQRAIIHSGVVIGSDGFGMANEAGQWLKIPQLGGVIIGNDVEIGANSCVDRGALQDTRIGNGVKLDNLIQVGHNVQIGDHTAIAANVAIGGSSSIGRFCAIGGGAVISDHVHVTDQVMISGKSAVIKDIDKPGIYASGTAVTGFRKWMRVLSYLENFDELVIRKLKRLEKQMTKVTD